MTPQLSASAGGAQQAQPDEHRLAAGRALAHFNNACALVDRNELSRAWTEFERVLELQPDHAEALVRVAGLAAQRGDASLARDFALRVLKSDPQNIAARIILAQADLEEEKFQAVLDGLSSLSSTDGLAAIHQAVAQGLVADALDGLGRTGEAFAAYIKSNETQRLFYRPQYEAPGVETALSRVQKRVAYFRDASAESWRVQPETREKNRTHVFLVGFARSGTTLLEQVLASHPDIESMEERECLMEAAEEYVYPPGGLDRLAALPEPALEAWRDAYWEQVGETGHSATKPVFIDKMPLNTLLLCLVAKLFPEAKIVFALRDPRDVVLGCFRRRFRMNPQMYELLTLSGAANYYDVTMQLAELYREKLSLAIFDARHETLVTDFDREIDRLCVFLGIARDDGMRRFAENAKRRGSATPSAPQVARGLYTSGIEQWRRYAGELAPVMPVLAPWVSRFGYSPQ
ncbi:MAG: sulfotransferase [Proteobacteria bacterium]|nr:sulfotransferase [Pseudomonadota bacterium]